MTLTRGMGSIGSSLNNICWVNIKEDGGQEGRDANMNTGKMARTPVPQVGLGRMVVIVRVVVIVVWMVVRLMMV